MLILYIIHMWWAFAKQKTYTVLKVSHRLDVQNILMRKWWCLDFS